MRVINVVETAINYTPENGEVVLGTVGAVGIIITLLDCTGKDNWMIVVRKVDAGVGDVGVFPSGGNNLDGVLFPLVIGTGKVRTLISKGGNWWLISEL